MIQLRGTKLWEIGMEQQKLRGDCMRQPIRRPISLYINKLTYPENANNPHQEQLNKSSFLITRSTNIMIHFKTEANAHRIYPS